MSFALPMFWPAGIVQVVVWLPAASVPVPVTPVAVRSAELWPAPTVYVPAQVEALAQVTVAFAPLFSATVKVDDKPVVTARLLESDLIEELRSSPDPSSDDERRRYYRLTTRGIAVARAEVGRLEGQLAAARTRRLLKGVRA